MTAKKDRTALPFEGFVPFYAPHVITGLGEKNQKVDGRREGVWVFVFPDRTLKAAGRYCQGKRQGFWEEYCRFPIKDGIRVLYETGYYRDDKRVGPWSVRYLGTEEWGFEDAQLEEKEFPPSASRETNKVEGDRREGTWTVTFSDGELRATGRYRHGKRHGKWKEVRRIPARRGGVRKVQRIGYYRDGERVGSWEVTYLGTRPWGYEDETPPGAQPQYEDTGGELS